MLRRIVPRRLATATALRLCSTNNTTGQQQAQEAAADAEKNNTSEQQANAEGAETNAEDAGPSTAIDKKRTTGLDPSDDPVWEYARAALTAEGRENQIEAVIYNEDSSYAPILARGKKNVYDITTDIPQHVTPQNDWHWYQSRAYFDMARQRKSPMHRLIEGCAVFSIFAIFAGIVTFTKIWLMQPKEVQELRGEILTHAYGRVLELGAGHGQNVGQYPYAVHEIVMMDQSSQLLNQIRYRLPKTAYPKYDIRHGKVESLQDVEDASFDCVVDMFGMCHYKDPVGVLRQMQRVVKPTGSLLLLEHGRSPYFPVNWFLDFFADRHNVNTHGCSWNRPMLDYFKEARLQVKEVKNMHYGTTYYMVAFPENIEQLKEELAKQEAAHA